MKLLKPVAENIKTVFLEKNNNHMILCLKTESFANITGETGDYCNICGESLTSDSINHPDQAQIIKCINFATEIITERNEINKILELKFNSEIFEEEITIREFFHQVLKYLWDDENDSGKRMFGYSSWRHEIYQALIANKLISGELDEDGYINKLNDTEAVAFVGNEIINNL